MEKTDVNNTALTIFFLAMAVMVIGGLAVIPTFEQQQAQADSCKEKDGVIVCKAKKSKDNV